MSSLYTSADGARAVERRYREYLDDWPVPGEQSRVPTREGETFVMSCGPRDAPPLVLLHGSRANAAMWAADAAVWSAHFRVHAVDMIGEPGLSAPSRPALRSDAYALWLDDVLEELHVERASLVGVSLGGWLAVDYATRRPERIDRMALLCPGGIGRQKYGVLLAAVPLALFGRRGRRTLMRLVLGVRPSAEQSADPERDRSFADFVMLIDRHFRPRRDRLPVFADDTLRRLTMPVLVIAGGRDALLDSYGTRRRIARNVPHATVDLLEDAGHLLQGQTSRILGFLRATERNRDHG
ncbi:alpha/beta hydrolase [Planotetraspora phitsanulokensis]|uniref:Ndr family protein n=1 Tax=Planotetraspora phitsanulokensis TaxID=575192 RepID=A0A8J3U173_9ACTN|nr:alpha/beta hydrolase [Planotetraspora phitsanulokensis]GII36728.1 Ndr family protein [Planotetraspora phitsanulokensis]